MSAIVITKENFDNEVLKSAVPVLLDFWAPWCGPCRMLSPVIEQIANEVKDFKVGKVNIDEQQALASEFGIMSIPTLVVVKDGKAVKKQVGAGSKEAVLSMMDAYKKG